MEHLSLDGTQYHLSWCPGLLNHYNFPKGIDFRKIDEDAVAEAVNRLNNRPRKCLEYRTPHEVFWPMARGALAN